MQISIQNIDKPVAYPYLNKINFKDMGKLIDLTGRVFCRLTVVSYSHAIPHVHDPEHLWSCICVCGNKSVVRGKSLKRGNTKSCGCLRYEQLKKSLIKHGEANKTKEFNSWGHMLGRCLNQKNKSYFRYGARGITVCERWLQYENFLADVGRAPSPFHSLDRIENNGNYEPSNCKWSTKKEQANNRRTSYMVTYRGVSKTLAQWSDELKIPYHRTFVRIRKGWSIESAFETI